VYRTWKKPWPQWRDGDPDALRMHLDHQEFGGPGMDRMDERWDPRAPVSFWRDFL
jgi:hypothetical protein